MSAKSKIGKVFKAIKAIVKAVRNALKGESGTNEEKQPLMQDQQQGGGNEPEKQQGNEKQEGKEKNKTLRLLLKLLTLGILGRKKEGKNQQQSSQGNGNDPEKQQGNEKKEGKEKNKTLRLLLKLLTLGILGRKKEGKNQQQSAQSNNQQQENQQRHQRNPDPQDNNETEPKKGKKSPGTFLKNLPSICKVKVTSVVKNKKESDTPHFYAKLQHDDGAGKVTHGHQRIPEAKVADFKECRDKNMLIKKQGNRTTTPQAEQRNMERTQKKNQEQSLGGKGQKMKI